MYSVFVVLFLISALMIAAGFLGRAGTGGLRDVDANVASAFALISVYALVFVSFSSFSELVSAAESMSGGILGEFFQKIPFVESITDYGSLKKVIEADPMSAAVSFLDTVILSATINILSLLPLNQGSAANRFMVRALTGVVLALIALLILNVFIKESSTYQWVVSVIGIAISAISIGTIPLALTSMFTQNTAAGVGAVGALMMFSQSRIAGILRDSFLKAIVFVVGIYLLEKYFGSVASGISQVSLLFIAFGPVLVMLAGLWVLLKCVKW